MLCKYSGSVGFASLTASIFGPLQLKPRKASGASPRLSMLISTIRTTRNRSPSQATQTGLACITTYKPYSNAQSWRTTMMATSRTNSCRGLAVLKITKVSNGPITTSTEISHKNNSRPPSNSEKGYGYHNPKTSPAAAKAIKTLVEKCINAALTLVFTTTSQK